MITTSQRYDNIKQSFDRNIERIIEDSQKSSIPNTLKMLINAQRKIDELIPSVELFASKGHSYAINAVMRIIYEHYIVATYIWLKARKEKNDDCAIEFYNQYKLGELLKRVGYQLDIEGLEKGIQKNNSPDKVKEKIRTVYELSDSEIQEAHRIKNQFDVKNILKYILNSISQNDYFREAHLHFPFYLQQYSLLSSYVHGGPSAEDDMYNVPNELFIQKTLAENLDHSKMVSETIKLHVLFFLIEKNIFYKQILKPLMEVDLGFGMPERR